MNRASWLSYKLMPSNLSWILTAVQQSFCLQFFPCCIPHSCYSHSFPSPQVQKYIPVHFMPVDDLQTYFTVIEAIPVLTQTPSSFCFGNAVLLWVSLSFHCLLLFYLPRFRQSFPTVFFGNHHHPNNKLHAKHNHIFSSLLPVIGSQTFSFKSVLDWHCLGQKLLFSLLDSSIHQCLIYMSTRVMLLKQGLDSFSYSGFKKIFYCE